MTNIITLSRHEQACLNILVHDRINFSYYEHWTEKRKYFYVLDGHLIPQLTPMQKTQEPRTCETPELEAPPSDDRNTEEDSLVGHKIKAL